MVSHTIQTPFTGCIDSVCNQAVCADPRLVPIEPNLEGVIAGAWTAQMPDGEEDEEGRVQAPSYALFMIGARCHKPFGIFDQRFARIGKQFNAVS